MGTKRDNRQKKKQEKRRKQRDKARTTRGSRQQMQPLAGGGSGALSKAASWPVGEGWLSGDPSKHDTTVRAAFSRARSDGRVAGSVFEIHMGDEGVRTVVSRADLTEDTFTGLLALHSSEDEPMMQCEPELVVKLLREAVAWQTEAGNPPPSGWRKVAPLLHGVDTAHITDDFAFSTEPTPEPSEAGPGLFERFKRLVGG